MVEGTTKMDYKNYYKSALKNMFDNLNRFLTIILLILIIITIFIRTFWLDIIKFALLAIIIFRLFSKNKLKRSKENQQYLKIKKTILKPFDIPLMNIKNFNKNVYKKCSKCHTTLKLPLPKKRGINHVVCPNCHNKITLFSLRKKKEEKIKVEVLKKKKA